MSALLTNNANGGTHGATVSYTNTGDASGDVWSFMTMGTGMTISFANAPARGGMAYKCTTTATPAQGVMVWNNFPQAPVTYVRFSAYLPSLPPSGFRFCELSDDIDIGLSIGYSATGRLVVRDYNSSLMGQSSITLPVGCWFRVEVRCTSHASAGQISFRIYSEVDSPYPAETHPSTASFNTKPNTLYVCYPRFGITSLPIANWTYYLDDLAVSDSGWLGSGDQSFVPSGSLYNGAEMGTNSTVATVENTGNTTNSFFTQFVDPGAITFSNTQVAHDSLSYRVQPTAATESYAKWMSFASQSVAARMYIYLSAIPGATTEFMQLTSHEAGTFSFMTRVAISQTAHVVVYDNASIVWTSTATLALNTWYRLEVYGVIGGSSTSGTINAAVYALDNTTVIDSFTTSSANTGSLQAINAVRFGKVTSTSYASVFYMDDLAAQAQAVGFIGPYAGALSPPASFSGIVPHLGWGRAV